MKDLPSALRQADGLYGPDGPYAGILGAKKAQEQGQRFREGATRTHYLNRVTGAHNSSKDLGLLRAEISKNSDLDPNQQSTLISSIDSRTAEQGRCVERAQREKGHGRIRCAREVRRAWIAGEPRIRGANDGAAQGHAV